MIDEIQYPRTAATRPSSSPLAISEFTVATSRTGSPKTVDGNPEPSDDAEGTADCVGAADPRAAADSAGGAEGLGVGGAATLHPTIRKIRNSATVPRTIRELYAHHRSG